MSSDEDRIERDRIRREIAARVAATDMRELLEARGEPYYTLGPDGKVVTHRPGPRRPPQEAERIRRDPTILREDRCPHCDRALLEPSLEVDPEDPRLRVGLVLCMQCWRDLTADPRPSELRVAARGLVVRAQSAHEQDDGVRGEALALAAREILGTIRTCLLCGDLAPHEQVTLLGHVPELAGQHPSAESDYASAIRHEACGLVQSRRSPLNPHRAEPYLEQMAQLYGGVGPSGRRYPGHPVTAPTDRQADR